MSNRPEWRMAFVARELVRYKVDISTLSETRLSEQGQLEEVGAGYTFFRSGRQRQSEAMLVLPLPSGTTSWDVRPVCCRLQDKCQEMRTHLSTKFVDLTKAFDTVNRDGLWKVMRKFGYPEWFPHMVRQLHNGMTARVTDNGTVSEAFAVTNGVKQGCVVALDLFSFMFSAMLMDAYRDEQPWIRIAYRTDGQLLNIRRMQASTRVSKTTVHDLLFADDSALNIVTEEDMQRSMDLLAAGCADFGLTISTSKTVFMHQPPPSAGYNAPRINLNGAQFKNVENFAYLGSTLSRNT
ncbi:unnamed protein product [Schistocephalus solidus]|uniref:Reverse transcriptase domain-containing protein n=1 Tax=Schistocephalus solidus TaxID=70667 RepID=A0A183SLJ7_SCHSO|nr:unnamed protein product [Schistocephalus solidus]